MLTFNNLFSDFLALRKKAPRDTLKGILYTSAVGSVAMLLSGICLVIPLTIVTAILTDGYTKTYQLHGFARLLPKLCFDILCPIFSAFVMVAVTYGALKLLKKESIKPSLLVKEAGRFAFSGKGVAFAFFYATAHVLASCGYILLFLPGLIATNVALLALFRVVDTRCGFRDAVAFGWDVICDHLVTSTVYFAATSLLIILISIASLFVLSPLYFAFTALAGAIYYGRVTGKPYFSESNIIS